MLSKLNRPHICKAVVGCRSNVDLAQRVNTICFSAPLRAFTTETAKAPESHEFKAETRKLLDIVAKSLYTDKEVFIRELISNASDALEKFRYLSSTQQIGSIADPDASLGITVEVDEKNRVFTITDSGIGMSRQELIDNLGTIARSGSKKFVEEVGAGDNNKIIGQFGVGFYSSFVVADKVRVYSRSADSEKDPHGYIWESDGMGSFTVHKDDSVARGTKIEIHLKEEAASFSKFETVRNAATKFSSFIDFPLRISNSAEESIDITQQEALWLKTKATEEEHVEFYRFLSGTSYGEPAYSFFFHTDAPLSIKSVFYIPEEAPDRMLAHSAPKSGVQMHSRRVLVTKNADAIIPQWLYWIRGVVDCEDMPLNISRENMQDSALLSKLSNAIVKRILRFLIDQSKKEAEKFAKFYRNYSTFLKAGLLEDIRSQGLHKEQLMKLLRFELVNDNSGKLYSLEEYVAAMKEGQKSVLYVNAPSRKAAQLSPYMDGLGDRPVLLLTDDIDDFVVNSIGPLGDKLFVSIDSGSTDDVENVSDAENLPEADQQRIIDLFTSALQSKKISDVSFSGHLVSSPAVVVSSLSPHMRKMMKNIMAQSGQPAPNEDELFEAMPVKLQLSQSDETIRALANIDDETVSKLVANQIFLNAMVAAGMIEDARVVLPTISELVKTCIAQAVQRRIE